MKNKQASQSRAMKKLYALTEKRAIDLSLSENPLGCSPLVSRALKKIEIDFNDYPTPNAKQLRAKLADKYSLDENTIFVANGSESIISDLPRVFCNKDDEVLIPQLTFPMFAISCELTKAKVVKVKMDNNLGIDLLKILENISKRTKMIFLCNPNNPTGSIIPKEEIIKFIKTIPKNILLIVDEANIEFGGESMIDEVKNRNNLVVLRTFSKAFGLASLRVGFMLANTGIVKRMEEETTVFPISGLSEKLASIAIEDERFIKATKNFVAEQRALLKEQLKKMGLTVFPSEANNLFVKLPSYLNPDEFSKKLEQEGVSLIRGSCFVGFDNSFFRISIRDTRTNQLFLKKMKIVVDNS